MGNLNENGKYCVYVHTSPSNKAYIGITSKDIKERWGSNGSHYKKNKHFWNAIQKYGWDNFKHEVLFENLAKEKACKIETLLIALFNTQNPDFGYNISSGGESGFAGCKLSDEARQKISEANKGRLVGENNRQYGVSPKERMDEETYNHWLEQTRERITSEEFREFMRQINVGKKYSDEVNAKKGRKDEDHNMYGKHHTDEAKEKIRRANTGRKYSDEINAKKGRKGKDNPSARAINQYDKNGVFIRRWDYITLASKTLGINLNSIIACCCGTRGRKTAGGFIWKYASDEVEEILCA